MSEKLINILLVEDNPADAVLIKEYFHSDSPNQFELQWVARLESALKLLHEYRAEAILLDLGLPDSNGFSTFAKVYEKYPQIPIIILTGFSDSTLATKAVGSGAQDYLVKGFIDSHSLLRSVNYSIERKRAEVALQESQRALETLMKNLPGMAYRCKNDRNWTMTFVSEGSIKLTGYEPNELINSKLVSYNSIIHPDDRKHVWQEVQTALDNNVPFRLIYKIQTKNDQTKWVWEQGRGVYNSKNKLVALEGLVIDITEQTEYQNKLRKLSAAVGQTANMICITDMNGIVEYVNPAFIKGTGYGFKDVYGKELNDIRAIEEKQKFFNTVKQFIESGKSLTDKIRVQKKSGEWYWERINVSPILDDENKITNVLYVCIDITTELEAYQQLVEADKMSAIGLLAAGVAHEFKNFLGGIIGYASYAQTSLDSENALEITKDALEHIVEIGERANEVAMSLLTYSKVKSIVMTKQDLGSAVEKTLELFSKELKNSCIKVETHYEDIPMIRFSSGRIQQILLNLLINARDAIEKHGNLRITISKDGQNAMVKVADNGIGIEAQNLTKVFDPFYSTKGVWGKDDVVGTGMGLSVSRNIAREHGGDLTVKSEPGKGSTFTLSLPFSEEDDNSQSKKENVVIPQEFKKLALISLNEPLIAKYTSEAAAAEYEIIPIRSKDLLQKKTNKELNLVLADAHFAAKVELVQMLESCTKNSIPFIMINCGAMEYQLNELFESALAVYRDCPDLEQIAMQVRSTQIFQKR